MKGVPHPFPVEFYFYRTLYDLMSKPYQHGIYPNSISPDWRMDLAPLIVYQLCQSTPVSDDLINALLECHMLDCDNFVLYNPQGQAVSHSNFMKVCIGSIGDEVYEPTFYYAFTNKLFDEWFHFVCHTPYPSWFNFSTKVVSVTRQPPSSTRVANAIRNATP